ncbi:dihydroneopterin aldolase [Salibacterium salarium]|uniref:7,8-dihydroneopterin aldolase n=1 Tax=Salibacterium salarium TaxID=284579 RepID=A0A3R9PYX3_9BACI|nr:dihydroneopterin aldolase [Salibacterium salarium]RSL30059.1 dihydroneopterin aldolase [Salibacterium salarium]
MDKIYIKGMEFYAYHGVFPEENKLGQRFRVDLVLEADLSEAAAEDNLNKSVNYADAHQAVKHVVEGETYKLVETVAEDIASEILRNFSVVEAATVKVIKPDPPIAGHYEHVAIEITRARA